jgi:hypothetical protein
MINCPVLILTGEDDPVCPLPIAEDLARQLPADTTRLLRLPAHVTPSSVTGQISSSPRSKISSAASRTTNRPPDQRVDSTTPRQLRMCADLVLRVGQDASYLAAEVDVARVSGLPRSGIGRQFGEGGPQRHHRLLGLEGSR